MLSEGVSQGSKIGEGARYSRYEKVGGYSPIVDEGEFTLHGDIFAAGK